MKNLMRTSLLFVLLLTCSGIDARAGHIPFPEPEPPAPSEPAPTPQPGEPTGGTEEPDATTAAVVDAALEVLETLLSLI